MLKQTNDTLTQDMQQCKRELALTKSSSTEIQDQIKQYRDELQNINEKYNNCESALQKTVDELESSMQEVNLMKRNEKELNEIIEKNKKIVSSLQSDYDIQSQILSEYQRKQEASRQENDNMKCEISN